MANVTEDPFGRWKAIQLTPEQKAEARARAEEKAREAAAAGAYERFAERLRCGGALRTGDEEEKGSGEGGGATHRQRL